MYMCMYMYPRGGTDWLAGLRAFVPSCVLKGYFGPSWGAEPFHHFWPVGLACFYRHSGAAWQV